VRSTCSEVSDFALDPLLIDGRGGENAAKLVDCSYRNHNSRMFDTPDCTFGTASSSRLGQLEKSVS
jgi:hypothetical protein